MIALNDAFFLHAVPDGWAFLSADGALAAGGHVSRNGVSVVLLRTGGARGPVHAYGMGDTLAQAHNKACEAALEGGAV